MQYEMEIDTGTAVAKARQAAEEVAAGVDKLNARMGERCVPPMQDRETFVFALASEFAKMLSRRFVFHPKKAEA